ncbi:hypothetical protein ACFC01_27295 [Streptomyces mirabilis]|nr:hypothetical protein [Streptomyces sp. OK228]SOE33821.1 hypothetical protein SAMN05442782_10905 [Streptomyces sp. OK228]
MTDDSAKSLDGAIGTHVIAITYELMDRATEALSRLDTRPSSTRR